MTYISRYMAPESASPLACENVSPGFPTFPKSRQRDNFTREDIWSTIERESGSYVITDIYFDKKKIKLFIQSSADTCFCSCMLFSPSSDSSNKVAAALKNPF